MQMIQFQKDFEKMNLQHQASITEKDTHIQLIQCEVDKLRNQHQTEEFIKETLELNTQF